MESIHLIITWSNDYNNRDIVQLFGDLYGINKLHSIDIEPSDDSTDPGGLVSLADLGYEEVAHDVSILDAMEIPIPPRSHCCVYVANKSKYLRELSLNQGGMAALRLGCVELRLGNHEVKGVMHSPEDINSWSASRISPGYSVIRADGSVAISGEGDGDYETLVEFVATHPRTKEIVTVLKRWCGSLRIFT